MAEHPIALVTGGAQGIGLACAQALAEDGYRLVLADIKAQGVAEAAETLGNGAVGLVCDMADAEAIAAMFDQIEADIGPISALVNNAGILESQMRVAEMDGVDGALRCGVVNIFIWST